MARLGDGEQLTGLLHPSLDGIRISRTLDGGQRAASSPHGHPRFRPLHPSARSHGLRPHGRHPHLS